LPLASVAAGPSRGGGVFIRTWPETCEADIKKRRRRSGGGRKFGMIISCKEKEWQLVLVGYRKNGRNE